MIITQSMVEKAQDFAQEMHKGQLRDGGQSYYETHVKVVGDMVAGLTDNENIIAAAYLHDVLEDCDVTPLQLFQMFGLRVRNLVLELTKDKNENGEKTFPRLESPEAIMIKFCDRAQNLSTMSVWDEKRQDAYLTKSKFWRSE